MTYLWIALGGGLGSMLRYGCVGVVARIAGATFPWGTLLVNVVGSFIIGLIAVLVAPGGRLLVGPDARAFVMVGMLGGFTTFSSFSLETLNLARDGEWLYAGGNAVASLLLCLTAVWLGHAAGMAINR